MQSNSPTMMTRPMEAAEKIPVATEPHVSWYRRMVKSKSPLAKFLKRTYWGIATFSLPAPKAVIRPFLLVYLALRTAYYWVLRVFVCEPLFKAYCKRYGKKLRTDCYVHFVIGKGDIIVGDNVWLDGKIVFTFGARFSDQPVIEIGDNTGIGHGCRFAIGKRITIGRNCTLSGGTTVMDSNGHPSDPRARHEHEAPSEEDVRPVAIGDNVWIGMQCLIFPGVKIGEGSVVSAGSVVRTHVPPYSVVAGNPARVMFRLKRPENNDQQSK